MVLQRLYMKVHHQLQQVVNARQLQQRAHNVLARRKKVLNSVGSMQEKQEHSKRQLQQALLRKAQVQPVEAGVVQLPSQEADALEPQKVTDIVGNTEDEKKDF